MAHRTHARDVLERLVERGLIEAHGERGQRPYQLTAALYERLREQSMHRMGGDH